MSTPTTTAQKPKVCKQCGTSLDGHRRYRDGDGYLCKDCHRLDKKRRVPCAECGKPTVPENLKPWGPTSICQKCFVDHERDPKARVNRKVSTRHFEKEDKRRAIILSAVMVGMVLFVLLRQVAC